LKPAPFVYLPEGPDEAIDALREYGADGTVSLVGRAWPDDEHALGAADRIG
jgi:hypothetical protein